LVLLRVRDSAIHQALSECGGSIQEADHYHGLAGDAAFDIVRLRLKLKEAGIDYLPPHS
jgi:hypothetical protein